MVEQETLLDIHKELLYEQEEVLINLIEIMIMDNKNINYFNFIKFINNGIISVYHTPSTKNKMILLNAIMTSLSNFSYTNDELTEIAINIIEVYNDANIVYIPGEYTLRNILTKNKCIFENKYIRKIVNKLTFLNDELMNKIIGFYNKQNDLTDEEYKLFELQVFTFASVFMNMDKLMQYLIKYINQ